MQTRRILFCLAFSTFSCTKAQKESSTTAAITADQTLSKLIVISDQLDPTFDPFVYQYTLLGGETRKDKLSINTAPVNDKYKIQVNGVNLRSDYTTDPMPLAAGANAFVIDLLDASGQKINTYKLDVQRVQELADEELDDLATSDGTLVPDFSTAVVNYTLTVGKNTSVLTVSPLTSYPDASSLVINGISYSTDKGGYDVNVNPGNTTVIIEIKGKSGKAKTYTIVVTRPTT